MTFLKLAFIGGWGHHYLRSALSDPDISVQRPVPVAGDGYDDAQARAFAAKLGDTQKLGETQWWDDPLLMLDTMRPDVVSIGAVYAKNGPLIIAALERGIAVVSDKPLAATWEDFARIETLTRGTDKTLLTEFPFRALPEFRAAQAAVAVGMIGDVVLAVAQKSYKFGTRPFWYADRALYGGTLLWVASHGIDVIGFTTGQAMICIGGRGGNVSRPDYGTMEDYTVSMFALAGGGTGVVHADFLQAQQAAQHGDDRLRLAGSRGIVEVRGGRCLLTTHDAPEADITHTVSTRPVHQELLCALRGEPGSGYSTAASIETARLLLEARDACDRA